MPTCLQFPGASNSANAGSGMGVCLLGSRSCMFPCDHLWVGRIAMSA